ncbi:MAG TPA: MBL fold metallo-hydrolase [Polyangiaceae bacterium]|nr:MBL fold metallo-hydrolase [Polyangiaceae bacterium]
MKLKRWQRIVLWVVGGLAVVLLAAKHFLLDTAAAPSSDYVIDLTALHRAASAKPGALPDHIEVEKVGEFGFPRTLVVAGDGFGLHKMVLLSHRVVWPDHSLIIDTAMTPAAAGSMPGGKFDRAAFDRVEKAMASAQDIVFTHEHLDHAGGLAGAPDFNALVKQTHMTREQLESPQLEHKDYPAGSLERLQPLDYEGLYTVTPGVVLQKAPGHSRGSQLVYVELASGARYLFVGDIAWTKDNIRLVRGRPALATVIMGEDRGAVAAQLRALAALPKDVHVVTAHDPVALESDLQAGLYRSGFSGL